MATLKCAGCGGVYTDTSPDGLLYFHACPPLAAWEVRAAIAANASPLTTVQAAALAQWDTTPDDAKLGVTGAMRGDAYLQSLALRRPSHRDENISLEKVDAAPKDAAGNVRRDVDPVSLTKSAGAGAVELADAADAVQ